MCIVDHIFPSKFYFDHYLTGARADQFLLADFICDQLIKNPTTAERKMVEGVTSSITLNWFISLFHGAVPTLVSRRLVGHNESAPERHRTERYAQHRTFLSQVTQLFLSRTFYLSNLQSNLSAANIYMTR